MKKEFKSGFVTLVGRSNTGKSTLLNSIVGTKIAAVTHKPQTTRNIIHGALNYDDAQAVFVDTPGIFKETKSSMSGKLEQRVHESIQDIDLIIYVVDPSKAIGTEERYIYSLVRKLEVPKFLVINKSDLPTQEKNFLDEYLNLSENFDETFQLSALHDRHIEPLRQKVIEYLPIGEPMYPKDQLTNVSREFWISEIIREKLFLSLRQEVPYDTHVEVESIEDKEDIMVIKANIFTSNAKYRKMIIGKGGRSIKEIGIAGRKELETALNKKVYLELEVEKDKHWIERM